MKSIKDIYNSLQYQDETILFQVKTRKALNLMLDDFKKEFDGIFEYKDWSKYLYVPVKDVFLFVGKWRLGAAGIFPRTKEIWGEHTFDNYLIDWKSPECMQSDQTKQVERFIKIMDKYREDIKISKTKYEELED